MAAPNAPYPPLPDPLVELVAERFRVIGEPVRIRILERLREGEASVGELTEALGSSQQNASRHLAVLHGAGIVSRRKEGTRVIYRIADPTVFALCEAVCGSLQQSVAELAQVIGATSPSGSVR
jgi:DNA-binding transcriptional ArsR family regulator